MIFLKLGGSLITDKSRPHFPRQDVIQRLSEEIYSARKENPDLQLIIGHGSGSFGHTPAHKYGTRQGVKTSDEWGGFYEVWESARSLNLLIWQALYNIGLPVISFPPSASIIAKNREIHTWNVLPIQSAIQNGMIPLIYGDVVFDTSIGGTILSTEDLFQYLACYLHPKRILLAGIEEGVWVDYPSRSQVFPIITSESFVRVKPSLYGSAVTDVTGGMLQKVESMLLLACQNPNLEVLIFSGDKPGVVQEALKGESPGTLIYGSGH